MYPIEYINSLELKYQLSRLDNDNFLSFYNKYLELDNIKPLFISKTKNKYKKINNLDEDIWKITILNDNIELFQKNIKIILNKLSEKNFDILFESIICELKKNNSFEIINIIIKEIINKIIFDKKFHNVYIKLITLISNNKFILNFITIIENNNELYWYFNNEKKLNGPYSNEKILHEFVINKYKFIIIFIDNLEDIFNKYLDNEKNIIFSILEFIHKLHEHELINQKIIHQILLKFLYYNDNFNEQYVHYFIYYFDILLKNNFFEKQLLFEYINYIKNLINNDLIKNTRNKILLENIIDTNHIDIKFENKDIEKIIDKLNNNNQNIIIEKILNLNYDKNIVIYSLIQYILNKNKKEYNNYINFIKQCQFITSNDLKINILSFIHNELIHDQKPNMISLISLINNSHQYDNILLELIES
jgi:hypothetical protein